MAMLDVAEVPREAIATEIVGFLKEQSIPLDEAAAPADIPLLEGDALDSLGIVQLTMFLGETYDIAIEEEDFAAENFATVGTLADLIKVKLGDHPHA